MQTSYKIKLFYSLHTDSLGKSRCLTLEGCCRCEAEQCAAWQKSQQEMEFWNSNLKGHCCAYSQAEKLNMPQSSTSAHKADLAHQVEPQAVSKMVKRNLFILSQRTAQHPQFPLLWTAEAHGTKESRQVQWTLCLT